MTNELNSCAQFDAELDRQAEPSASALSLAVREHLASCARCRSLYQWVAAPMEISPAPGPRAKIQAQIDSSLRPVAPLPSTSLLAFQFLAVFGGLALALIVLMGRAGWHTMTLIESLLAMGLFALAAIFFAFSLAGQMVPASLGSGLAGFLTGAVLIVLGVATAGLFPWTSSRPFVAQGFPCALTEIAIAVPVAAAFWLMARRGAPLSRMSLAITVSGFAGLLGFVVLQIRCPHQEAPHLLIWHLGGMFVVVVLGLMAAQLDRNRTSPES